MSSSHDDLRGDALKANLEFRYNVMRACIDQCHFQKQTLAVDHINHAVYECLPICATKY